MTTRAVLAVLALGIGAALPARAATVGDYLRDGWDIQGFSNSPVVQMVLRKKDHALFCTIETGSVLNCADMTDWRVNEVK